MPADGGDSEQELAPSAAAGIDVARRRSTFKDEGAKLFISSGNDLMGVIKSKFTVLERTSSPYER